MNHIGPKYRVIENWFLSFDAKEREAILNALTAIKRGNPFLARSARLAELHRMLGDLHDERKRDGDE